MHTTHVIRCLHEEGQYGDLKGSRACSYITYRVGVLARLSKSDRKTIDKEERNLNKILTAVFLIDASISKLWHSVLDLTYRNLIKPLQKVKEEPVMSFQEYLRSSLYCPVFHKEIAGDFQ